MFERLPIQVHRVWTVNGSDGLGETAGRFTRHALAEVSIQSEIIKFETHGADSGSHWGRNSDGTGVRYWIEID